MMQYHYQYEIRKKFLLIKATIKVQLLSYNPNYKFLHTITSLSIYIKFIDIKKIQKNKNPEMLFWFFDKA